MVSNIVMLIMFVKSIVQDCPDLPILRVRIDYESPVTHDVSNCQ